MNKVEATDILVSWIKKQGFKEAISIIYCEGKYHSTYKRTGQPDFFEFGVGKPSGLFLVYCDDGHVKDAYNRFK